MAHSVFTRTPIARSRSPSNFGDHARLPPLLLSPHRDSDADDAEHNISTRTRYECRLDIYVAADNVTYSRSMTVRLSCHISASFEAAVV